MKKGHIKIANKRHSRYSYILGGRHPRSQHRYWLQPQIGLILVTLLPFPYIIPSAVFNTPFRLPLASDIFVKEASIFDVPKRTASALDEFPSRQQKESFLWTLQLFNANCWPFKEVSVIQLHINPPATVSQVNWITSMKQIIWSIWRRSRSGNQAPRRGRWASRDGED